MAKVTYSAGIDKVSGALSKPKKQNGHSCGSYLIGTHREAPTQNPNCSRLYIKPKDNYERSTSPNADELAARLRFSTVAGMVKARKLDLSKVATDQAAFLAQKDSPNGRKTIKAYYWMICGDEYDAQHS